MKEVGTYSGTGKKNVNLVKDRDEMGRRRDES